MGHEGGSTCVLVGEATWIEAQRGDDTPNEEESSPIAVEVVMTTTELPDGERVTFKDTSFFKQRGATTTLTSPTEVRKRALAQGFKYPGNPPPIRFPDLGLIVKSGTWLTIGEGQCLWAIKRHLGDRVPVPEVYGWARDGMELFIYMELIQGDTLESRWDSLSASERLEVSSQLRKMMAALRSLKQDPQDPFIGNIGCKPLLETILEGGPAIGPFGTVKRFHNFFAAQANRAHPNIEEYTDPWRPGLPEECPIVFTHSDLHSSNIILTPANVEPVRVLAIIDWHQSGWYPAYWEYCKTVYSVHSGSDWASEYVPMFLEEPPCFETWAYYLDSLGC